MQENLCSFFKIMMLMLILYIFTYKIAIPKVKIYKQKKAATTTLLSDLQIPFSNENFIEDRNQGKLTIKLISNLIFLFNLGKNNFESSPFFDELNIYSLDSPEDDLFASKGQNISSSTNKFSASQLLIIDEVLEFMELNNDQNALSFLLVQNEFKAFYLRILEY